MGEELVSGYVSYSRKRSGKKIQINPFHCSLIKSISSITAVTAYTVFFFIILRVLCVCVCVCVGSCACTTVLYIMREKERGIIQITSALLRERGEKGGGETRRTKTSRRHKKI